MIAVTVVLEDADGSTGRGRELERQWARWNPGVPLRGHPDVVCARVSMPLEPADGEDPGGSR